jgi:hypothetical protein
MSFVTVLLYGLSLYVIMGLCTAAAFSIFGVTRVLADAMTVTVGARILLLPGVAALWPYVLFRWLASGRRR